MRNLMLFAIIFVLPFAGCAQKEMPSVSLSNLIATTHQYFSETPVIRDDIHSLLVSENGNK